MDYNDIILSDVNKMFEYEKISREIDSIDDIDKLKSMSKMFLKLYLFQQETIAKL